MLQVHGDPHVMPFKYQDRGMVTCSTLGSMTLLDNEHLSIMAQTQQLKQQAENAEVICVCVI